MRRLLLRLIPLLLTCLLLWPTVAAAAEQSTAPAVTATQTLFHQPIVTEGRTFLFIPLGRDGLFPMLLASMIISVGLTLFIIYRSRPSTTHRNMHNRI